MKEEIAKLWIADLRSGRYEQGTGFLKRDGKYCCLGRLCDISQLGSFKNGANGGLSIFNSNNGEMYSHVLPETVMKWASMKSNIGVLSNDAETLSKYNDSGKSFLEIADLIEQNWKEL